jgi:hypothetical protein
VPKISSRKINENPHPWQQHSTLKTQFHNVTSGSIGINNTRAISNNLQISVLTQQLTENGGAKD